MAPNSAAKNGLTRLVHCEPYERIGEAIALEKAMKAWHQRWKTKLIEKTNPKWLDLSEHLLKLVFNSGNALTQHGPQPSLG